MEGRYINILIPARKDYLSLCEVKVTGQPSEKPAQTGKLTIFIIFVSDYLEKRTNVGT